MEIVISDKNYASPLTKQRIWDDSKKINDVTVHR